MSCRYERNKDSEPKPGTRAPRKQHRFPPAPWTGLTCAFQFRLSQKGNSRLMACAAAQCMSLTEAIPWSGRPAPRTGSRVANSKARERGSSGATRGFWPGRPEEGRAQFCRATTPHSVGTGVTYLSPLGVIRPALPTPAAT